MKYALAMSVIPQDSPMHFDRLDIGDEVGREFSHQGHQPDQFLLF